MKRSGRIHWMIAVGIVGILIIAGIVFWSKEGPEATAGRFMAALAKGDVNTLTDLSYFPNGNKEELRKQWEFSTQVAGKYLRFSYRIKHTKVAGEDSASVTLKYIKDTTDPMGYDENYEIPMVKENGKWYVDVASISRTLYPALPR